LVAAATLGAQELDIARFRLARELSKADAGEQRLRGS